MITLTVKPVRVLDMQMWGVYLGDVLVSGTSFSEEGAHFKRKQLELKLRQGSI